MARKSIPDPRHLDSLLVAAEFHDLISSSENFRRVVELALNCEVTLDDRMTPEFEARANVFADHVARLRDTIHHTLPIVPPEVITERICACMIDPLRISGIRAVIRMARGLDSLGRPR